MEFSSKTEGPDLPRLENFPEEFPVVDEPLSYEDFYRKFLLPNRPCLIKGPPMMDSWNARRDWRTQDDKPNLESLARLVPKDLEVPVSRCDKKYFNSQDCCEQKFGDYVDYWTAIDNGNCPEGHSEGYLYLKDWHFHRDCSHYQAYTTPLYFCSDWLNEYWESFKPVRDDYRFVYVGPRGSWTPFHSDVFGSFSWSANIVGKKHWIFIPPGEEEWLKDINGKLIYDLRKIGELEPQEKKLFPNIHKFNKRYDVIQESGDLVFVPSNWHHQVHNLEPTLSINHNWFNGSNVGSIFQSLVSGLDAVEKELEDCRIGSTPEEWFDMCQRVLRANHGMNLEDFLAILGRILDRRASSLTTESQSSSFDGVRLGPNHAAFDIRCIGGVLAQVKRSGCLTEGGAACQELNNKLEAMLNTVNDLDHS